MTTELQKKKCIPCSGELPPATPAEIAELKPQIPDWQVLEREGQNRLQRVYAFPDFLTALAFTQKVGEAAELEGHHPALLTEWGRVTVTWWTHAIGGLHENDFVMAAKTDQVRAELG
jgi:4a-hydroxytetrahydrobiopterin dehydratase